jgi:hypothetical protein
MGVKIQAFFIAIFVCLLPIKPASAEEAGNKPVVNSKLLEKAEALIKSASKVIQNDEGVITLTSPGHSYASKTQMLFFRKHGNRIEMIGTGIFIKETVDEKTNHKELVAELDRDTIIKYPEAGDYGVPMTDPSLAALDGRDSNDLPAPADEKDQKRKLHPGYLEFGMGLFNGSMDTSASGPVNIAKKTKGYRFQLMHLAYYSSIFPIGIELDTYKGNFPTSTYKGSIVTSDENISSLGINYRFRPVLNNHLVFTARVNSISETFNTNNDDDSLLTTTLSGLGFGLQTHFQLVDANWKKSPADFFIQMQSFSADFVYYPSITANDGSSLSTISRGTSSNGSTLMQYRVGATALAWISFIPLLKRWVINGSYGAKAYNLKFSGPTISEVGNPEKIAENGTSKETESDYRFFIGVRLNDPFEAFFGDD